MPWLLFCWPADGRARSAAALLRAVAHRIYLHHSILLLLKDATTASTNQLTCSTRHCMHHALILRSLGGCARGVGLQPSQLSFSLIFASLRGGWRQCRPSLKPRGWRSAGNCFGNHWQLPAIPGYITIGGCHPAMKRVGSITVVTYACFGGIPVVDPHTWGHGQMGTLGGASAARKACMLGWIGNNYYHL